MEIELPVVDYFFLHITDTLMEEPESCSILAHMINGIY